MWLADTLSRAALPSVTAVQVPKLEIFMTELEVV